MLIVEKNLVHFAFDPEALPCARARDGDIVIFRCQDCYSEQILADGFDFRKIDMERNNPATGPLWIEGAEPGDVLRVEIQSIEIAASGCMTARAGTGVYEVEGRHCRRFGIEGGEILFDRGIRLPVRPMIGVIGTAPAGEPASTQLPGEHGGNLDIRDLVAGTVLYLPVNVPGALLSMGDIHALQGDGETVICALEVSGEVRVKLDLLKGRGDVPTPFLVTRGSYLTTSADPSLDLASVAAARKMHAFLVGHTDLDEAQAAMLLSLAGNLRISQVVNPAKGCIMEFPIGLAGERFER